MRARKAHITAAKSGLLSGRFYFDGFLTYLLLPEERRLAYWKQIQFIFLPCFMLGIIITCD